MDGFIERLKALMKPGESVAEFARRGGTTAQMMHLYLMGYNVPRLHTIEDLAKSFKVKPGWLAFGHGKGPKEGVCPTS